MNDMSSQEWNAEITSLWFSDPTMRDAHFNVHFETGPDVDFGWISSLTASFFYGHTLIGETTLEDKFITPEYGNSYYIEFKELEIKNMTAFKKFVRGIMPKPKDLYQPKGDKPTAKLEVVENGHRLAMTIDLCSIGRLKATVLAVQLTGNSIEITVSISNPTPVEFYFDMAEFTLKRDGSLLARLAGQFDIEEEESERVLKGDVVDYGKLFGKAILSGRSLGPEFEKTWYFHAIRDFKIEVNLNEMVVRKLE